MSKPVKEMIVTQYKRRFDGITSGLLIDIRGIEANTNNELRVDLLKNDIHITVLKNSLAKTAFQDTELEGFTDYLEGPSALAFGGNSVVEVARNLVDWAKKIKKLELKAAVLDGEFFEGADGVKRLSDFPTKEEAQSIVVQLLLSPAGNVIKAATNPGSMVVGVVKEMTSMLKAGKTVEKIA
ncbi:50S ribosomal protein L10 [PVC group bacterium]|nr:50S ribosomal protein L10 [PVC group bacterium]